MVWIFGNLEIRTKMFEFGRKCLQNMGEMKQNPARTLNSQALKLNTPEIAQNYTKRLLGAHNTNLGSYS